LFLFAAAETSVDRGRRLWNEKCKSCHDGPERNGPRSRKATIPDPGFARSCSTRAVSGSSARPRIFPTWRRSN
jgi:hypothetical protein